MPRGVAPEVALYLLPNAHRVRFYESGTLLDYFWKWVKRLCYDAQREIFEIARQEVAQVREVLPTIGRSVDGPPCVMRSRAGARPVCPEGERYCGIPSGATTTSRSSSRGGCCRAELVRSGPSARGRRTERARRQSGLGTG